MSRESVQTSSTWKDGDKQDQEQYHQDEEEEDEDDEEEDEDNYDDEEEENSAPMFEAAARLMVRVDGGEWQDPEPVLLRIIYDDDVYGARIIARQPDADDEDPDLCDHVIAIQTK